MISRLQSASTLSRVLKGRVGWLAIPPFLYVAMFFILPLALMVKNSLPGASFGKYSQLISEPLYRTVFVNTLAIACTSTGVTIALGSLILAALYSWGKTSRAILVTTLLVPFVANEVVRIVTWFILLGPTGPLERGLALLPWSHGPGDLVKTRTAVVIAIVNVQLPFFVLTAYPAVRAIKRSMARAAESLGAPPPVAFLSVFIPLAMPGLIAAGLISFVLSLGYYATPAALGGQGDVVASMLVISQFANFGDWGEAAAVGVALLLVTVVALFIVSRFGGLRVLYGGVEGSRRVGHRGGWIARGWQAAVCSAPVTVAARTIGDFRGMRAAQRAVHKTAVLLIAIFLVIPVLSVLPASLTRGELVALPPRGLSLRWYRTFFADPNWTSGLKTSVLIAALTSLSAVVLGLAAAIALVRGKSRFRSGLLTMYLMPLIMPTVVTALGLQFFLLKLGIAYTRWGIMAGHIVFALPYAVIVLTAALQALDWDVVRAAESSGANAVARFRDMILPLMKPAIYTALGFCFIVSFSEFTLAFLMHTVTLTTLPVMLWNGITFSTSPTTAAASGLIVIGISLIWVGFAIGRRTYGLRHASVRALQRRRARGFALGVRQQ
jgi:putative spermidine/putrescine transport system permease protein